MTDERLAILLAEDDEGHASLIQRNLKRAGVAHDVVHVRDGQEVLDYLRHQGAFAGRPGRVEVGSSGEATPGFRTYFVRDNGSGIPPAYSPKVFQAFQRLQPERAAGEGMGLAIVRRIIERHGGKVWLESTHGTGSTFSFTLPVANEAKEM